MSDSMSSRLTTLTVGINEVIRRIRARIADNPYTSGEYGNNIPSSLGTATYWCFALPASTLMLLVHTATRVVTNIGLVRSFVMVDPGLAPASGHEKQKYGLVPYFLKTFFYS